MNLAHFKPLMGKLNDTCQRSLNTAVALCMSRTHYNVEVEHWLLKMLDEADSDVTKLLGYFNVEPGRLARDLTGVIDRLKSGNARPPSFSPNIVDLCRDGWLIASLEGSPRTRSGHLLQAMMSSDALARLAREASAEFQKISPEALAKDRAFVTAESAEAIAAGVATAGASGRTDAAQTAPAGTTALDQYTIDLTERARSGKIDPVLGRDAEIRQIIDILTRRRQNNPILTGEAGVGKTAVVEGFASRVAAGDVPPSLRNSAIRTLDLGLLQAGAGVKGEFENRLKTVIEEVKSSAKPIILFIDEAHTMIGAGGPAGQGDAANLLKPALARGELRTIAATTWGEYKEYFEKDPALARRFQVVKVDEPTEAVAVQMMRGLVKTLEKHHRVEVLEEAVVDAVRLSHRYISGRQLPDKSVSLLDTACARVALGLTTMPPALEDARRRSEQLDVSIEILQREIAAGAEHGDRLAEMTKAKAAAEAEVADLTVRWEKESALVEQIRAIRGQLGAGPGLADSGKADAKQAATPARGAAPKPGEKGEAATAKPAAAPPAPALTEPQQEELRGRLRDLSDKLREQQGQRPLMQVSVDSQAIAEVVSGWTGIPVGRMVADEIKTVLRLRERMEERIVGQSFALEAIAQSIRTSRAKMTDPRKPIGVFLMVGTSGVGKTETALTLAELLYGGEQNMTVINMTEFKEEHKVSLLMGSPPGYVGYGKGGVLTEAVRRKPYSVILLDEMEKAHPGVQDIFYQVFDKGMMRDSEGREIDFRNTVIIMTSNAATDLITKVCADPETRPEAPALAEMLHPELIKTFKPAFLGRVTMVPYLPLADDVMRKIIELQLGRVARRVKDNYAARFEYTPEVVASIADRCKEVSSGARNVDHILTRTLLPELSSEFLARLAEGQPVKSVSVSMGDEGKFRYAIV